jgi:hypothetical protein
MNNPREFRGCVQRLEKPDGKNPSDWPGKGLGKARYQVVKYRRSVRGTRILRKARGRRWNDAAKRLSKRSE